MQITEETPINASKARERLGCSRMYVSALKRATGTKSRYVLVSSMLRFIRDIPTFTAAQIYRRDNCRGERDGKSPEFASFPGGGLEGLPAIIRRLKGARAIAEVIKQAGISRETYRKIQHGAEVRRTTIEKLADCLEATEKQRVELVIAWLLVAAGKHASALQIKPRPNRNCGSNHSTTRISSRTSRLNPTKDDATPKRLVSVQLSVPVLEVQGAYDDLWAKL